MDKRIEKAMLERTQFNIKMKKRDIVNYLTNNRDAHIKQYEKARIGYLEKVNEIINKIGLHIASNEIPDHGFRIDLRAPELKSNEYDKCIKMFELSVDDIIELSTQDYDKIVNDNWDWIISTKTLNATYI